jgi:hypothetical protein
VLQERKGSTNMSNVEKEGITHYSKEQQERKKNTSCPMYKRKAICVCEAEDCFLDLRGWPGSAGGRAV